MTRRFVIEAVMVAIYGELLAPSSPVEYIVPYNTIMELYEFRDSTEPLMNDPEDDRYVKDKINELIAYMEEPLNRKRLEKILVMPWGKTASILLDEHITWTVVNAVDNEQYGEYLDPIETEIILTAQKENAPILTDQFELIRRIIEAEVPVQVFDIQDFEFAMEDNVFS
ncbi:ADP-heptose synthase [Paenibacillus yonginensis]|uniref:ADP-heptose synthase n=1 Tax=Paenibacillus yonginensis TaxID=1462996 RepID=A0A1B1MY40_9BACL|nr:ADP-heptose synthase [Paenibacillus yonginensis]ANS74093.1 ADP-heptose synthase [Paenibacillus yonginensis]